MYFKNLTLVGFATLTMGAASGKATRGDTLIHATGNLYKGILNELAGPILITRLLLISKAKHISFIIMALWLPIREVFAGQLV